MSKNWVAGTVDEYWQRKESDERDARIWELERRLAILEDVVGKIEGKNKPVEQQSKIDLSQLVPGQYVYIRSGRKVYFIGFDKSENSYVFRLSHCGGFFECDVYGDCDESSDCDIIEILPLEEDL